MLSKQKYMLRLKKGSITILEVTPEVIPEVIPEIKQVSIKHKLKKYKFENGFNNLCISNE